MQRQVRNKTSNIIEVRSFSLHEQRPLDGGHVNVKDQTPIFLRLIELDQNPHASNRVEPARKIAVVPGPQLQLNKS